MKSSTLIPFVFFFSLLASPAQDTSYGVAGMEGLSRTGPSIQINTSQPGVAGTPAFCPLSLRAQHGATGGMMQANKSLPKGPAQLLHLTLVNPDSRQIASARFLIRGVSGKARATQALAFPNGRADATRTVAAQFSSTSGNTATGDLWVPGMTAVMTINVTSVTFADGSTQGFTPQDACRVAPDLKMLVASH